MKHASSSPHWIQVQDYSALSRQAADLILAELERKPDLLLCAAAGGSPTGAYQRLAALYATRTALFDHLRVLQVDEWAGLPHGHPASCETDLQHKLVQPLHLERRRFIGFRTDANPERECRRVARWLQANGPIDVCVLGLGQNGHVAMNEPAPALAPHAHVAKLTPSSLRHAMLQTLRRKPRAGLTLGMADILGARKILLLVSGPHKRACLGRLLQPQVTTRFPASLLWLHPDVTILYDREAAPPRSRVR